jgi:hypothetical protein
MAIYTVFAFGTGESNVMERKNIISQFSRACLSDHCVIDGPGVLGREVRTNVAIVVENILEWLKKLTDDNLTLNLSGYSRGSVTCISVANRLKEFQTDLKNREDSLTTAEAAILKKLKNLKINLFVIDPVAGLNDKRHKCFRVIPDNVKSYVSVLQTDEMRRDFKVQDLSRIIIESSASTEVVMLPMYGNHSDTIKIKHDEMHSGPMLVWYVLYSFLIKHGTTFIDEKIPDLTVSDHSLRTLPAEVPTAKDLLQLFTLHHRQRAKYLASGKLILFHDGLPIPRKMRSLNKYLDFYVKNADFFVNQLERELFKISYPKVFNYLFERNQVDFRFIDQSGLEKSQVIPELLALKNENNDLFIRLQQFNFIKQGEPLDLGEPTGIYCLEPCTALQQIFSNLVPNTVSEGAVFLSKLAHLEQDIYRLCFRYEREKNAYRIFSDRSQAHRTKKLRNDIRALIEDTAGNSQIKYMKILDRIELDYKGLLQSRSKSDLSSMLQVLLIQHGRQYQKHVDSVFRLVIADFIHACLSLLKGFIQLLDFVGSVMYLLPTLGMFMQDFGRRCNDALECIEDHNAAKYVALALVLCISSLGFIIRHSFGITPLIHFIDAGIRELRDAVVTSIAPVAIVALENGS